MLVAILDTEYRHHIQKEAQGFSSFGNAIMSPKIIHSNFNCTEILIILRDKQLGRCYDSIQLKGDFFVQIEKWELR